jgi:hypothetical protein
MPAGIGIGIPVLPGIPGIPGIPAMGCMWCDVESCALLGAVSRAVSRPAVGVGAGFGFGFGFACDVVS